MKLIGNILEKERGLTTATRPESGEKQNSSGNLKIIPRIGRQGKFFWEKWDSSGAMKKKSGTLNKICISIAKNREDRPNFREDNKWHILLVKQPLLELPLPPSPPPSSPPPPTVRGRAIVHNWCRIAVTVSGNWMSRGVTKAKIRERGTGLSQMSGFKGS